MTRTITPADVTAQVTALLNQRDGWTAHHEYPGWINLRTTGIGGRYAIGTADGTWRADRFTDEDDYRPCLGLDTELRAVVMDPTLIASALVNVITTHEAELQGATPMTAKTPRSLWMDEHPDADVPAAIWQHPDLVDVSWHNDIEPSFIHRLHDHQTIDGDAKEIRLWVSPPNPEDREVPDMPRFSVQRAYAELPDGTTPDDDASVTIYESPVIFDDPQPALAALIAAVYADPRVRTAAVVAKEFDRCLREDLTPPQYVQAVEANRLEPPNERARTCHTHDVCDANMTMQRALAFVLGRDLDFLGDDASLADDDTPDVLLWNAAWRHWMDEYCAPRGQTPRLIHASSVPARYLERDQSRGGADMRGHFFRSFVPGSPAWRALPWSHARTVDPLVTTLVGAYRTERSAPHDSATYDFATPGSEDIVRVTMTIDPVLPAGVSVTPHPSDDPLAANLRLILDDFEDGALTADGLRAAVRSVVGGPTVIAADAPDARDVSTVTLDATQRETIRGATFDAFTKADFLMWACVPFMDAATLNPRADRFVGADLVSEDNQTVAFYFEEPDNPALVRVVRDIPLW